MSSTLQQAQTGVLGSGRSGRVVLDQGVGGSELKNANDEGFAESWHMASLEHGWLDGSFA